jgi:hypothetical protein
MTPERFETLAEAFGGDVARWPQAEREVAAELMAAQPTWAQTVLAGARALDSALSAYAPPTAAPGLAERIAGSAPRPRAVGLWGGWLLPAGMAAGLAAACAAGVILGARVGGLPPGDTDSVITAVSDDFGLYLDEDA